MANKLSIFNLAFSHLGEPTVTTLTDDPVTPNVAKANAQWDQALETAQTRAPWLCVLERTKLPLDVAPAQGWGDWRYDYRFTCPAGTLKLWTVNGLADDDAWQKATAIDENGAARIIVWSVLSAALKVELSLKRPPEALPPLLVDALGFLLASRLAGPILKSEQRMQALTKQAEDAFVLAEASEAGEIGGQEPVIGTGSLLAARLSAL